MTLVDAQSNCFSSHPGLHSMSPEVNGAFA